ncbi:hypothetical protein G6F32_016183 [Rhizopus arrhizus]|nr:hypothetical protein G6F24_016677 [Rhizopus arrhizus]KAG0919381.1 hypothetical protein G6F32_016183 [Rhizopus arrhizus]
MRLPSASALRASSELPSEAGLKAAICIALVNGTLAYGPSSALLNRISLSSSNAPWRLSGDTDTRSGMER